MSAIFLSASVPVIGREPYFGTANPFLIQTAVRELVVAVIRTHRIVWGGHPSITPMVWNICNDLGVSYSESVILYQSKFFEDTFPVENEHFGNIIFTDAVARDRDASLTTMRRKMISREDLVAAVFIGGMEGAEDEFAIFREYHPSACVVPVPASGGAALNLAKRLNMEGDALQDVDFASLFHAKFGANNTERGRRA